MAVGDAADGARRDPGLGTRDPVLPPTPNRWPPVVRGLILVVVVTAIAILYAKKIEQRMPDYEVYRRAAARAANAEPLYRPDDGHYQFKYLPAFAVATLPVGLAPERVVRAGWFAGTILLLVLLLRTAVDVLPDRRHTRAALIGMTVVLLAKFYAHEIELGQVNILMTALVVLAVGQMRVGREVAAGLLIAAAVVVKPYAVLLMPYLAARRRLGSLAGAALGLAIALLLPALVYGFSGNLTLLGEWWRTVTETTAPNLMDFNNVSAASVFARWIGPGQTASLLAALLVLLLLGVAGAIFLMRGRVAVPEPLEVAVLLTLMPLISPQGWDYVFLLSTLAVMLLVNYASELPRPVRIGTTIALCLIAFSIFDIMGRPAYQRFMRLSIITICYLVVIGALAILRQRRVA
ncbi:MAG: glycosyltransferase family 87 protein [Vicinamibacterales bacterium]